MGDVAQEATTAMAQRLPKKGSPQYPALAGNIQRLIAWRGTNATALAKKAGLGTTTVNDIISERTLNPSSRILRSIAAALDVDVRLLMGPPLGEMPIQPQSARLLPTLSVSLDILRQIPVVAVAETGVWREYTPMSISETTDARGPAGPFNQDFAIDQYVRVKVAGSGMDAAKPFPLMPGSEAYCVDMVAAHLIVETGRIYAIRRWRDDRRQSEVIIRRAYVFADHYELRAETHHPDERFKTISMPGTLSTNPEESIHAFGLVMSVLGHCYMS